MPFAFSISMERMPPKVTPCSLPLSLAMARLLSMRRSATRRNRRKLTKVAARPMPARTGL